PQRSTISPRWLTLTSERETLCSFRSAIAPPTSTATSPPGTTATPWSNGACEQRDRRRPLSLPARGGVPFEPLPLRPEVRRRVPRELSAGRDARDDRGGAPRSRAEAGPRS